MQSGPVTAAMEDGPKRRLEEGGAAAEGTAKRAAAEAAETVPALMQVEDFSPDLLRIYYDRLFPYREMFRWLSYRNDPKSTNKGVEKDFFLRREFTFVLAGDIFCRYQCFRDAEEFRAQVIARQPIRMEIGAVFSHPPKNHSAVVKEAYKPRERELVFDIDMDDYDDIRTCCTGAKLCHLCWNFMKAAIKTLERALREDFGFQHFFFVYSGRRGVHCWVCDKAARQLSDQQRSAVAEYLTLVATGAGKSRAMIKMNGCEDIHPSIEEACKVCEPFFKDDPLGVLRGQDILRKGPHLTNILEQGFFPAERETVNKFLAEHPQASSREIWAQLELLEDARSRSAKTFREKQEAKLLLKEVVLQYTYPRLDINVSKQMNHLLKSPWVVHPKTGRVCVPIDPARVGEFDPARVPTVGKLVSEINEGRDVRQTSLRPYMSFWETRFLQPMEAAVAAEMREDGALEW